MFFLARLTSRSDTTLRIYSLLSSMQSSFLEKKYKLKHMEEDKESKNLQLRRARDKHNDRQSLLDDAEAEVENIKISLAESTTSAARYVE
jgi:hypothetical protein